MLHADIESPGGALTQLVGSSLYLDELNDQLRNAMYCDAIIAVVRPGDHILDIGTGSGLLACLAVKALQRKGATIPADEIPLCCLHSGCDVANKSSSSRLSVLICNDMALWMCQGSTAMTSM